MNWIRKIMSSKFRSFEDKDTYTEFLTEEELKSWGTGLYGQWADEYVQVMKRLKQYNIADPIKQYCGTAFGEMNLYLRNKEFESDDDTESKNSERIKWNIELLLASLMSTPKTDRNIIVYRSVSHSMIENFKNSIDKDEIYKEHGFMSTSLNKQVCFDRCFKNYEYLKVYVPAGIHALYVNIIEPRDELELLLPPETALRLIELPRKEGENMIYEVKIEKSISKGYDD